MWCLVAQSYLTLWLNGLEPARLLCPWDSPGKNTEGGCHALLQGIFPTQGLNPGLPHCRRILYCLSHQGSPRIPEWVAYPFSRGTSWPRNWTRVSRIAGRSFTSWATREALTSAYYPPILTMLLHMADFALFSAWVILHCINAPHLYPLVCWWTRRLFAYLGYCGCCCYDHRGAGIFPNESFYGYPDTYPRVDLLGHMVVLFLCTSSFFLLLIF